VSRTLCLCLLFLLPFTSTSSPAGGEGQITILHTNDMHAQFLPKEALWVKETPRPLVGGFVRIQELVDSLRGVLANTLLVDAGDVMTGNPITDRMYRGAEGGALFEMMNLIGYDLWSPGNHDLDISQENLRQLIAIPRFPAVSANLRDDRNGFPLGNHPYEIIERGGVRIGIIGVMHPGLYGLVNQNNLAGVRVLSPLETVQRYIDEIDPKTDLIVVLSHQGVDLDSAMAEGLRGADVIVGGHSHTRLRRPKSVNGVLIVQAGSNTENLGVLELTVADDRVVKADGRLVPTWVTPGPPRPGPLVSLVDSMKQEIDKEYSEVIGTLTAEWKRGERQSPIGTFIAEAQRVAAGADVGFMNTHGIRKDQPAGPMTKGDLFEILPFRNLLATFQLSGAELTEVVRRSLEQRSAIQIAGLTARFARNGDHRAEVREVLINGKPVEPEAMYRCAASDYFVGEAKNYLGMDLRQPTMLQRTVFAAVEEAIRKEQTIEPRVIYAIQEIK
jgi:2',3'-cyclic-nucleotide 2'-phosphodiesterase (5'-nucleotidase family)